MKKYELLPILLAIKKLLDKNKVDEAKKLINDILNQNNSEEES